jgi:hypothetical protein
MAKRLIYVGPDDDISDLAGKLQAADPGDQVALTVPPGAQAFQTPLNVRLLRSVAMKRGLTTTIVSPDPRIQEVAQSAGLPVYSSVAALEGGIPVESPRPGFRPGAPSPRPQAPFLPEPPAATAATPGGARAPAALPFEYVPRPLPSSAPAGADLPAAPVAGGASFALAGADVPGAVPAPRTGPWGAPIVPPRPPALPEHALPASEPPSGFLATPGTPVPGYPLSNPAGQISPASPPYAPFLPASPAGPRPRPGSPWSSLSEIPDEEEPVSPWAGARAAFAPAAAAGVIATPAAPPSPPVVTPPPPPRHGSQIRQQPPTPPPTSTAGRLRVPPRTVIYGVVVGVLALGVILFLLLGSSATVTITVAEPTLTVTPTIQGTTSTAQATQPNYILSKQLTDPASQTFQVTPTGTQAVPGVAATGYVVLTTTGAGPCSNGCSFTLTPAYEFETTGTSPTVLFGVTSPTPVIIPGGGDASNQIPVTALTTGAVGNVPQGAITVCTSAAEDWCTTDALQADNPAPTTGGVDAKNETVASASDIANWQEQLGQVETQLGQTATADLATKAGQDKVALDPSGGGKSITYVVSPSSFPPATAGTVMTAETVTVTMTAQETVYNPADLDAVVLKDLQASSNLPAGDSLVPSQLQLNNLQIIQAGSDGSFALSVSGVDYYHGQVDLSQLKSQISGRSPGSVQGIVEQAIPNVQSVTVAETPVQFLFMPFSSSSIHIVETFVTSSGSGSSASG